MLPHVCDPQDNAKLCSNCDVQQTYCPMMTGWVQYPLASLADAFHPHTATPLPVPRHPRTDTRPPLRFPVHRQAASCARLEAAGMGRPFRPLFDAQCNVRVCGCGCRPTIRIKLIAFAIIQHIHSSVRTAATFKPGSHRPLDPLSPREQHYVH